MKKLFSAAAAAGILAAGLATPALASPIDGWVTEVKSVPCNEIQDEARVFGWKTRSDVSKFLEDKLQGLSGFNASDRKRLSNAAGDRAVECKAVKDDRNPLEKVAGSFDGSSGSSLSS